MNQSSNFNNTILFIHEIPTSVSEEEVRVAFDPFGEIMSISIHKKNDNKSSSVKIKFARHEQAKSALDHFQHEKLILGGSEITKISWNQPNPHRGNYNNNDNNGGGYHYNNNNNNNNGNNNNGMNNNNNNNSMGNGNMGNPMNRDYSNNSSLVVSSLPANIKDIELREKFAFLEADNIRFVQSKQILILSFKTPQIATDALKKLNGFTINDQPIKVDFNHARPQNQQNDSLLLPKGIVLVQTNAMNGIPEHVYGQLNIKENDTLLFFDSPEASESFIKQMLANRMNAYNKVKAEIFYEALRYLEKRMIYADGFKDTNAHIQDIVGLFEQNGRVIKCDIHNNRAVVVQYEKEESRATAFDLYHHKILPELSLSPLTILPYIEKRIPRPEAGLLQINELPPTKLISELKSEFTAYGEILTVSITPTGFDEPPYGFVLFNSYENAYEARQKCQYPNVFLYPPLKAAEAIFAFTENPVTAPNNCLVVYDIPMATLEPEINAKYKHYGFIKSSYVLSDGKSKVAYLYFTKNEDAVKAYADLIKENKTKCDLMNGYVLDSSVHSLGRIALPMKWGGLLLFVQGLPTSDFGTTEFRRIIHSFGVNIESCFVRLVPMTGLPNGNGIILASDQQSANMIIHMLPLTLNGLRIAYFGSTGGYSRPDPIPINSSIPQYLIPQNSKTPREWIKQFAILNFNEYREQLAQVVDTLSVNTTHLITSNYQSFIKWIEGEVAKLKG